MVSEGACVPVRHPRGGDPDLICYGRGGAEEGCPLASQGVGGSIRGSDGVGWS